VPHEPVLSRILSQLLVAYIIECDNEFEHRIQHRSASQGRGVGTGPWLTSMAMWANFLRYLPPDGAERGALEPLIRMTNLAGMQRWRYVDIEPAEGQPAVKDVVRPTRAGRETQRLWPQIVDEVEARWETRFGRSAIDALRTELDAVAEALGRRWPDLPPVLGYGDGMRTHVPADEALTAAAVGHALATNLGARLSRVLVAFTVDYEQKTRLSLAMLSDVLRVIGPDGRAVRDLPAAGGVSKEGVASALGFLGRHRLATVGPDPERLRVRRVTLTERGRQALAAHSGRLVKVEGDWRSRCGAERIDQLREALDAVHGRTDSEGRPLLAAGLTPYPDGWRAQRPYLTQTLARLEDPWATLPRQPMVLHRGGYPDGS
jgi:DNA-binding MarR family transcriptional regulator